ncbi:MAG: LacI family DNA-binding transcriptional regulator [Pseudomonadota bacterium]
MAPQRQTVRDIARETGLSVATVSRAMNDLGNVSPKTRDRVLAAARQLNYVPNPAARALSTKRTRTIAAIIPTIEHSIFARFLTAIESELTQLGYSLVIAVSNNSAQEELEATEKLLGLGAEGFIFTGLDHDPALFDLLDRRQVPHVLTSGWCARPQRPLIGYDNGALAAEAVNYLHNLGHRTIGIFHGPLTDNDRTRARLEGAQGAAVAGMASQPIKLHTIETELSVAGGSEAVGRLLAKSQDITAILCFSDILALGASFRLQQEGLSVPDHISLMGFDNLDWSASNTPPLTTIDLPTTRMGRLASAGLVNKLDRGHDILAQNLEGKIIPRASTGRPRTP